jgi:outer membrane protein insertion porin family
MKFFFRLLVIWLLLGYASVVWAQTIGPKINRVEVKFIGPSSVSEQFIRSNIRSKAGGTYLPTSTQDDVHSLYGTGQFYNIRVSADQADDGGVVLTYIVQARPRLSEVKLEGNDKLSNSKLQKKITVKVGDPLDEQKLFSDVQEMKKLYEKYGYPDTQVKYVLNIDENAGRGSVTFQVVESPKIKITQIEFIGAAAFSQKQLLKQIKTSKRWMFSWITGSGVFKQDDFDDDKDSLVAFYRGHGYLDFEIKDVKFEHPAANRLAIRFYIYEGRQYKVGVVKFTGNRIFSDDQIHGGLLAVHDYQHSKDKLGAHNLAMDAGDVFTPDGLNKDTQALEDFYGSKGYIEVAQGALRVNRIPNVETGTMDLEFQIDEGQKSFVEKIDIRGNLKTKDKVIRRELAIAPGDVFDMVRVKISKERLEGLQYFDKVDLSRSRPTRRSPGARI